MCKMEFWCIQRYYLRGKLEFIYEQDQYKCASVLTRQGTLCRLSLWCIYFFLSGFFLIFLTEPRIVSNHSIFQQEEARGRIYLTVGQRATMFTKTTLIVRCPTEGIDKPNIQWLKGSAVIPQNRNMRVRKISGGSLKFARLAVEDSGVYTCQAGALSENFHLRVGKFFRTLITLS